ncbi:MAG: GNAT family protein [Candidatus Sulfotelmatobacter sp.]
MEEIQPLIGRHIRLEPLAHHHVDGLVDASAAEPALYQWSPVPQGKIEATAYVNTALAWRDAGTAVPYAIVKVNDDRVIGSTRFWNIERWSWPEGHARQGRCAQQEFPVLAKEERTGAAWSDILPDACEIGYTWFTRSAIRTPANTEAKLLMLTHAFESWEVLRVCFHTDARNQRSRAALERIGGKFEGILRSHRMAADFIPRDSVRYSIVAAEWPDVKRRLTQLLDQLP